METPNKWSSSNWKWHSKGLASSAWHFWVLWWILNHLQYRLFNMPSVIFTDCNRFFFHNLCNTQAYSFQFACQKMIFWISWFVTMRVAERQNSNSLSSIHNMVHYDSINWIHICSSSKPLKASFVIIAVRQTSLISHLCGLRIVIVHSSKISIYWQNKVNTVKLMARLP